MGEHGKPLRKIKEIMKTKVFIQNLKCGGCAKSIESELNSIAGVRVVNIDNEEDFVEFTQDSDNLQLIVLGKLKQLGYPPINEKNSIGIKAKSVISCIKGRLDN